MPINITLEGIPRYDASAIRFIVLNFQRIKDAFGSAIGGPLMQSGTVTANFSGATQVDSSTSFSPVMTNVPHMVFTVIGWSTGTPETHAFVKRTSGLGFDWRVQTDVAYTGTITLAWLALPR